MMRKKFSKAYELDPELYEYDAEHASLLPPGIGAPGWYNFFTGLISQTCGRLHRVQQSEYLKQNQHRINKKKKNVVTGGLQILSSRLFFMSLIYFNLGFVLCIKSSLYKYSLHLNWITFDNITFLYVGVINKVQITLLSSTLILHLRLHSPQTSPAICLLLSPYHV